MGKNLRLLAFVGLLMVLAFSLGMYISPLKRVVEVKLSNDELQARIYGAAMVYSDMIEQAGYDLQIRSYKDVLAIPFFVRTNGIQMFLNIAELKDVNVVYISYTEMTLNLPVFWYAYYDEGGGTIVTWSPYA